MVRGGCKQRGHCKEQSVRSSKEETCSYCVTQQTPLLCTNPRRKHASTHGHGSTSHKSQDGEMTHASTRVEESSAINRNDVLTHAVTQMNLGHKLRESRTREATQDCMSVKWPEQANP